MTRTEEIQDRLDDHFERELQLPVISMDAPRWACIDLPPAYETCGWAFPVATLPQARPADLHGAALSFWADEYLASFIVNGPCAPMVFVYSPDVMADSTAHLNDEELEQYLTVVEFMLDRYIAIRDVVIDPLERLRAIEDELYGVNPARLDLLTSIQMGGQPPAEVAS